LIPGYTIATGSSYITDTQTLTTSFLVHDGNGNPVNPSGYHRDVSGDGRLISFHSTSDTLTEDGYKGHGIDYAYIRDLENSTTTLALPFTVAGLEIFNPPRLSSASANGRFVTFTGADAGLAYGDSNSRIQVVMLDRQTGLYTLITRAYPGHFSTAGLPFNKNLHSPAPVSNDGVLVAFITDAVNLVETGATGGMDLYVYNTQTDTMTFLTGRVGENASITQYSMSASGQYLAFASFNDSLAAGDANNFYDIFLYNTQTTQFTQLSVDSDGVIGGANGRSYNPSISQDGNFVIFESDASNLVADDNNGVRDIFVRDIQTGQTFRVSNHSNGEAANGTSRNAVISAKGRYVSFVSTASNLVAADTNVKADVFVNDRQTGITTRVSVDSQGGQTSGALSGGPSISADGQYVAFNSFATDLIDGDTNGQLDVFIHDNFSGTTALVSKNVTGEQANGQSYASPSPVLTENGSRILFRACSESITY